MHECRPVAFGKEVAFTLSTPNDYSLLSTERLVELTGVFTYKQLRGVMIEIYKTETCICTGSSM